jgi:hypothetical protein
VILEQPRRLISRARDGATSCGIFCDDLEVYKVIIAGILCGSLLPAQTIKRVVPAISVHQYSSISPLSANKDKLHIFDLGGHARIVKLTNAAVIADPAPYPEAHWDNVDNDLMWLIGTGGNHSKNRIETWRPSTQKFQTVIDYSGRFTAIMTGATTDITYDDWEAFWAENEHQVCAVDLKALKTYCLDYDAPDPLNKVGKTTDINYVAVTPRDSKSGLHYVLLMASTPCMAIFSVDEKAGTLRWVMRPENVVPLMGSNRPETPQNNDGNCDPKEPCLTTPHGDVFPAPDGQVYFVMQVGIDGDLTGDGVYHCEEGEAVLRLNAGLKMMRPERLGGGLRYFKAYECGQNWSSAHFGCARWGQICVISYDSPPPKPGSTTPTPRQEDIWLIDLNGEKKIGNSNSSDDYWSQSRAGPSMDGTIVIFDSDQGTHGSSHAVYSLASGLAPVSRPVRRPPDRSGF